MSNPNSMDHGQYRAHIDEILNGILALVPWDEGAKVKYMPARPLISADERVTLQWKEGTRSVVWSYVFLPEHIYESDNPALFVKKTIEWFRRTVEAERKSD